MGVGEDGGGGVVDFGHFFRWELSPDLMRSVGEGEGGGIHELPRPSVPALNSYVHNH